MRKQGSRESSDAGDSPTSFSVYAVCLIVELVITLILKWKGGVLRTPLILGKQGWPVTLLLLDLDPWVQGNLANHHGKGDGRNWAPAAQTLFEATPLRPRSRGSSCRVQTEPSVLTFRQHTTTKFDNTPPLSSTTHHR